MRGHIKKRGNNWSVIIEYPKDPITGKRNQKWFTVKGDKKCVKISVDDGYKKYKRYFSGFCRWHRRYKYD